MSHKITVSVDGHCKHHQAKVSVREANSDHEIASGQISSSTGQLYLEVPSAGKYEIVATEIDGDDNDGIDWVFAEPLVAVNVSQDTEVKLKGVQLLDHRDMHDDDVTRQFVLDLLVSLSQNAPKIMDDIGVAQGREFIRRIVMEGLDKNPQGARGGHPPHNHQQEEQQPDAQESDFQDYAPQQQQQWKPESTILVDEPIVPQQIFLKVSTGDRLVRPLFMLTCATCFNRYNTPGTSYYMNKAALDSCLTNPPCT